ncbi:MAG: ABC transporter permease [Clostridiales bacterium]|nr:ABC transporter permease [Clostridiales bacterium]
MKKETKLSISQVFVYLVLLFVFVFFSVLTKTFLSTKNLLNICRQVSMTGICAVGMTMVLLTGGIDISIGSIIALSGVVSAKLINDLGFGIFPAMVVGVLVGIVCGLISGIMVAHFEVPALIATLAMQTIARGFAFIMTQGIPVYGLPESIKTLGQGYFLGFQSIFWHWFFSLAGGCSSRQALAVISTQSAAMKKLPDCQASTSWSRKSRSIRSADFLPVFPASSCSPVSTPASQPPAKALKWTSSRLLFSAA